MKHSRLVLIVITIVLIFSVPTASAISQTPTCPSSPTVQEILNQVTEGAIVQWIRNFSGEDFVPIGGGQRKILTRYSPQLFNMNVNALAYPYLGEQLESFGYEQGTFLIDHTYSPYMTLVNKENAVSDWINKDGEELHPQRENLTYPDQALTWKNKVVIIPGHGPNADEIVLITAHLDSTTYDNPLTLAPGAEDNASGIAALMEAARLPDCSAFINLTAPSRSSFSLAKSRDCLAASRMWQIIQQKWMTSSASSILTCLGMIAIATAVSNCTSEPWQVQTRLAPASAMLIPTIPLG